MRRSLHLCILINYLHTINVNCYYQIFGKASSRIAVETSVCICYLMINHPDLILTILDNQWDKGTIRICHIFIIVGSPWGSQFTNINTRMSHGESFLKSILGNPNSVLFDNDNQSQS